MASEKMNEYLEMSVEELNTQLGLLESELDNLLFEHATTGLDNPLVLREKRRGVAVIKTAIRQKELSAMTPEQLEQRSKIRDRRKKRR